jgi:hypothetical protein
MATTLDTYRAENDVTHALASATVQGLLQRIRWRELYPHLLREVVLALETLAAAGHHFWVTQGERTWAEQHELYLKGRRGVAGEGIVTKVDQGDSAHNYAVAVDAAYDKDGDLKTKLQPSWDKPWMKIWADACAHRGLEAGYYWTGFMDGPHVQLPLKSRGLSIKNLKAVYANGGKLAVFHLLDTKDWY